MIQNHQNFINLLWSSGYDTGLSPRRSGFNPRLDLFHFNFQFLFLIEDRLLDTSEVLALKNARPQGGVCIENSGYFIHLLHWFAMVVSSIIYFSYFLTKFFSNINSYIFFIFLIIKIKNFECPKFMRNYEKNNTWNIQRLVGGSIDQTNKRFIVIYIRLTEFKCIYFTHCF